MKKIKLGLFIVFGILISCKTSDYKKNKSVSNTEKTQQQSVNKLQIKDKVNLDSLLQTVKLSKLKYDLHPYNGLPIFTFNSNKNIYYNVLPIGKSNEIKSKWVFDEFTDIKSLTLKSKAQIINNLQDYNLVLFLVENELDKQNGFFSPTEDFNYKIFINKGDKWALKKESRYPRDLFIYLDSELEKDAKKAVE